MPWRTDPGQPTPWRADSRLAGFFAPGYEDDVQVLFMNPDTAAGARPEVMWVAVIAYDQPSDQYLGILLNQPVALRSVAEGDNVVFRADSPGRIATAVSESGDYGAPGWPSSQRSFGRVLRDGIRAYRAGRNGHNVPGIERCIEILAPAVKAIPLDANANERFIAHFVLGRCLAETYKTERAIEQFRAAIALDSTDVDAQMALLAEFSVMTHNLPGSRSAAEVDRWDRAFIDQLAVARSRFGTHPDVVTMLEMIFDPSQEAQVTSEWRADLPRLRRIGYGILRWKRR